VNNFESNILNIKIYGALLSFILQNSISKSSVLIFYHVFLLRFRTAISLVRFTFSSTVPMFSYRKSPKRRISILNHRRFGKNLTGLYLGQVTSVVNSCFTWIMYSPNLVKKLKRNRCVNLVLGELRVRTSLHRSHYVRSTYKLDHY